MIFGLPRSNYAKLNIPETVMDDQMISKFTPLD